MKKSVLIVAHGSRETSANREFVQLVRRYQKRHPGWSIAHAFLEFAWPRIPEALGTLSKKHRSILVLPLFLFAARHVKKNIPQLIEVFRKEYPGVKVRLGQPLGADPKLFGILDERLNTLSK